MIDFKTILTDLIKTKDIQEFINNRFKSSDRVVIKKSMLEYLIGKIEDPTSSMDTVLLDYNFQDIRPYDIVLDIGANVGCFSILASRRAKHVYAVEPLYFNILKNNIYNNSIDNITAFDLGLGKGLTEIGYDGVKKIVPCYSLSEIIALCVYSPTFLKLDCEGAEWSIHPSELKNIRRIEAEIHNFDNKHNVMAFFKVLLDAGFEWDFKTISKSIILIHARKI